MNEGLAAPGDEMDPLDERICALLAQGWSHSRIASEVGRSTKTVQRRVRDPEFAAEVRRRRRASVAAISARLEQLGLDAVDGLRDLLASPDPRVLLRAVELTLQLGRRYHTEELMEEEVLSRLEALEHQVEATDPDSSGREIQ